MGDDSIIIAASGYLTINGGTGNDIISLYSAGMNDLIEYNDGDGFDIVYNFQPTDTLQIGGGYGTYSTETVGSDIVVTVGEGKITLTGAANLSNVNIQGSFVNPLNIVGTQYAGNISNTISGATINALGGNDTVSNYDSTATINGGAGNDYISNDGGSFAIINGESGADKIYNNGSNVMIDGGDGFDSIDNDSGFSSTINGGYGNDYINNLNAGNVTINAGAGSDTIQNSGSNVTINGGAGNDSIYNIGYKDLINGGEGDDTIYNRVDATINGGEGNDSIKYDAIDACEVMINGDAGNDSIENNGSDGTISGGAGDDYIRLVYGSDYNLIQYKEGDGNDTVRGFGTTDTLEIGGGTGTYSSTKNGSDIIVTVGEGSITLKDAANYLSNVNISGEEIFTEPVWTLDGTTATYGTANENLITVTGVKSLDGISLDGTTVTIADSSTNNSTITISDGYTLALASNVSKPNTTNAWAFSGTTATYNQTTSAGYTLTNNEITYSKKSTTSLVTVEGVTSKDGLSLNGNVVTVGTNSLGTEKISISDGYTLALVSNVSKPNTTNAWAFSGTTATYNQTTTAGYTLASDSKSIKYSKATAAQALAQINGVTSTDALTINGNTITASASGLASKISVSSDSCVFDFASDYKKAKISGGEDDDTIKAAGQKVTLTGGADDDSIFGLGKYTSINAGSGDNFVELGAKASNSTVRADDGFDTVSNKAINALIDTKGGKDLIVNEGASSTIDSGAGNDSIANSGDDVSINAGTGNDTIFSSGHGVSIDSGTGNDFISAGGIDMMEVTLNNSSNKFMASDERDDYYINAGGGADTIVGNDGNDTIIGGTGNDSMAGGNGSDLYLYANGDGKDIITDYEEEDTIQITSGTIDKISTNTAGHVVFKIGSGTITVQNAADKIVKYIDASGETHYYPVSTNAAGTSATLTANYGKDEFKVSDFDEFAGTLKTINASNVAHDLKITANKNANKIIGTDEDDTIDGGAGRDTILGRRGQRLNHGRRRQRHARRGHRLRCFRLQQRRRQRLNQRLQRRARRQNQNRFGLRNFHNDQQDKCHLHRRQRQSHRQRRLRPSHHLD